MKLRLEQIDRQIWCEAAAVYVFIACWLLVVVCWSLFVGCWLLVESLLVESLLVVGWLADGCSLLVVG